MLELFGPMPLSFGDESQEMLDRAADYPSPERAREIARETGTPVLASDLWIYPPQSEELFHRDRAWSDLRRGLFAPDIILPDPANAVAAVPEFMIDEVRHMAAERIAWLRAFGRAARAWREADA